MNEESPLTSTNTQDKIPWTIVLLLIGLVIFASYQLFGFAQVLIYTKTLAGLGISPTTLALARLSWGILASFTAWSIWSRKKWSRLLCTLFAGLYGILFWINHLFIFQSEVFSRRWPVNLVFTFLGFGAITIILKMKSTRAYFGKNTVKIT